jgi:hypothetical protein
VLIWAIGQAIPVLTRDTKDFRDLHELIVLAGGHHPGLLLVYFDDDPRNNMGDRAIAGATGKLESSGVPIPDRIHPLNPWR